ncbi:MAG: GNAT family N-acetyltransferase [Bacteroidia bacterium]
MEQLHFRFANTNDVDLYYEWANDPLVRSQSYRNNEINYNDHVKWFNEKLRSDDCKFYLFVNENNIPVGQVRIDKSNEKVIIGISIDEKFRGKSFGNKMLLMATDHYLAEHPGASIYAYIKTNNVASYHAFKKAGFGSDSIVTEQGAESFELIKK